MPQIGPFMKLFFALLVVLVALFGWQRADMAALETRLGERFIAMGTRFDERLIAMGARFDERLIAMETRFDERFVAMETRFDERFTRLETRFDRLEAGQSELRERTARIEGTVAGALSRPGTLAQVVEDDEASAN